MARLFTEEDVDKNYLKDVVISVLGYGNQGTAQSANLRDSGCKVVIGNSRDSAFDKAIKDGFETYSVAEAVSKAAIHLLLLPDETMPDIFEKDILPNLHQGDAIVVSSGYNVMYKFLKHPEWVDLLMVAPRMIGTGVRNGYLDKKGFPSLVSVEQDYTGLAFKKLLALSHAVGTIKGGAFESSCYEETLCDLFNEHFGYVYALQRAYELLVEAGASPEAAMLEFWASGEEMELARVHMTHGLFHQLELHSETSQYGQEITSVLSKEDEERERDRLRGIITRIKDGSFAIEWKKEQENNCKNWKQVHEANKNSDLSIREETLLRTLGVLERN